MPEGTTNNFFAFGIPLGAPAGRHANAPGGGCSVDALWMLCGYSVDALWILCECPVPPQSNHVASTPRRHRKDKESGAASAAPLLSEITDCKSFT